MLTIHTFSNFPGTDDVWFSLRGTTYQNNSCVALEDIGEGNDALLCRTEFNVCCKASEIVYDVGDWYFPNGSDVFNNDTQKNFYITRDQMAVHLNRRRGGEEGIYSCVIPDSVYALQTIYIGLYTANTSIGE